MPESVTCLNQAPIFQSYAVWCGSKNGYRKDFGLQEIGVRVQNMIVDLGSTANIIGGPL